MRNNKRVFTDIKGLTVDRIDNDGNYVLDNIEFLTRKEHLRKHLMQRKEEYESKI